MCIVVVVVRGRRAAVEVDRLARLRSHHHHLIIVIQKSFTPYVPAPPRPTTRTQTELASSVLVMWSVMVLLGSGIVDAIACCGRVGVGWGMRA